MFPCCVLGVQPSVCALDKKTSMVRAILAWLALGNVEIMTDLMRGKKRAVLSGERKNCGGYFHAIYCSAYRGGGGSVMPTISQHRGNRENAAGARKRREREVRTLGTHFFTHRLLIRMERFNKQIAYLT